MSFETFSISDNKSSGVLNGRLYRGTDDSGTIAVVAHPYGPLGGSQQDPVVIQVAKTLQALNANVLTFDFVAPTSWTGKREQAQYLEVVGYALHRFPAATDVCCCGYSYGTLCLPSSEEIFSRCERRVEIVYIVISPLLWPVSTFLTMSRQDRYKHIRASTNLAIWGVNDNFTSSGRLKKIWTNGHVIPDADHFWLTKSSSQSLTSVITAFVKGRSDA